MAESWRVYYCANPGCHLKGIRTKIFGQLCGIRFHSWPALTCTACGHVPAMAETKAAAAVPVPEKAATARRKR